MMDIEQVCRDAAQRLNIAHTFLLSTEWEANYTLDYVTDWPVIMYVSPVIGTADISMSETVNTTYDLMFFFLEKLPDSSLDNTEQEVQAIRRRMELLCYRYFIELSRSVAYQRAGGKKMKLQVRQVAEKFDVHVAGVAATTQMQFEVVIDCKDRPV